MDNILFEKICNYCALGLLQSKPKAVSGGYMHKMYCIQTETGVYAVKLLNPVIMLRDNVMQNFMLAEQLEYQLQSADIPVVPALEFHGKKMQCVDNQYFYVFNWVTGQSLKAKQIKETHCAQIGKILAQIHKLECNQPFVPKEDVVIDWNFYIEKAKDICPKVSKLLEKNKALLYSAVEKGNAACKKLPQVMCISNGDMDSKNVLWLYNKPQIIDLECLKYDNPFTELFQLSLCWCGYEHSKIRYSLLGAFITSYIKEYGSINAKWEDLYYSNIGRLEWLEYNVKRALLIECRDRAEQKLGIGQVKETIKHIVYYDKVKDELLLFLNSII